MNKSPSSKRAYSMSDPNSKFSDILSDGSTKYNLRVRELRQRFMKNNIHFMGDNISGEKY